VAKVGSVSVSLRVLDTGPLSGLGGFGLCCMASLVAPSNVKPLITVRMTTPRENRGRRVLKFHPVAQ